MIIEAIRDIVIAVDPGLVFILADEFEANLEGDKMDVWQRDHVILNTVFVSDTTLNAAACVLETLPLEFLFLSKDTLESKPEGDSWDIIEKQKKHARKFLVKLDAEKTIRDPSRNINNIKQGNVFHLFDADLTGIRLTLEFPLRQDFETL